MACPDSRVQPHGYAPNFHPIGCAHDELCPGMMEKVRQFREEFQPELLVFNSKVSSGVDTIWVQVYFY